VRTVCRYGLTGAGHKPIKWDEQLHVHAASKPSHASSNVRQTTTNPCLSNRARLATSDDVAERIRARFLDAGSLAPEMAVAAAIRPLWRYQ
jgi:hypothetical protein